MAKLNYEQALEKLTSVKAELKGINGEIGAIRLTHKVEKGGKPKDKKVVSEWNSLHEKKAKLVEEREKLEAIVKETKPVKTRETKYEYPEDCITKEQRKNYRAKMRTKANSEEKQKNKKEKPVKEAKPEKKGKAKTEETPEPAKKDKKGKKDKGKKSGKKHD